MERIEESNDARYFSTLGLSRAPFHGGVDACPFFYSDAQKKALDAVLYLARYSDLVALIHGPSGSGKTAFRHELARCAGSNVHVASIAGDATLYASTLCAKILESFSLVEPLAQLDEQVRQIREQIDLLQRKGYHCILLVDDAHTLPRETFAMLETLINLRGETGKSLINLVLFAPRPDRLPLDGPTLRHRLKPTSLVPLTTDETLRYLQHRLVFSGASVPFEQIFRMRDVTRIARESKGWPGTINALAQQTLLRYVAKTDPAATPPDAPRHQRLQIAFASVLGIGLVAGFVFQSEFVALLQSTASLKFSAPSTAKLDSPPNTQTNAPEPMLAVESPTPAATMPTALVAPSAAMPSGSHSMTAFNAALTAPSMVAPPQTTPARSPAADDSPDVAPAANTAPEPTPAANTSTPSSQDIAEAEIHAQDWILSQNPAAYTIQLVGSPDQGDVRRTLKRNELGNVTATFETIKKDKAWYGLVHGVYPDFDAAKQARAALPTLLAKRAWVRRVSAVQSEIAQIDPGPDNTPDTADATSNSKGRRQ